MTDFESKMPEYINFNTPETAVELMKICSAFHTMLEIATEALEIIKENGEIAGVNADTLVAKLALEKIKGVNETNY